ncbi:MAG: family 20 glycosylhydrolase [Chitinophagaceae bacterium]|nr:family 20 glycosylhydrolase [Chitinophagaceae bacterium]
MQRLVYLFFTLCSCFSAMLLQGQQHTIIPRPVEYFPGNGQFLLSGSTRVVFTEGSSSPLSQTVDWFKARLSKAGIEKEQSAGNTIQLTLLPGSHNLHSNEGYRLSISDNIIKIEAKQPAGIFYAMQTLLQMVPVHNPSGVAVLQGCSIMDYPQFKWRGLMLDVSRHFFTVAEVKQYLDLMAACKLNVFHWHLTDDNGWRIEIKSYPKLTQIGGCRVVRHGTFGDREAPRPGEKATDCNFYTQDQIREIVAYAALLHITVVPEIDVPGHSLAAIAAYPELSVTGEPQLVNPGSKFSEWYGNGTFKMLLDNTLNPADEKVYTFLDKVFGEVAGLFPGSFIHAGGDECYHGYWEKSAAVQAMMKKEGIKDMHGVQSYFMKRVAAIIASKGKKMIGWDEILDGGLAEGAAVMSWRGTKGGVEAAKLGHEVVMSPTTHAYLDYMQADASIEPRVYASLHLKTCYEFNPLPEGIDARYVLGGQGNLWTEKVPHFRHATYMTYPRAWALAEALWLPDSLKNWTNFTQRVETHFDRSTAMGLQVSKAVYEVIIKTSQKTGKILVHLECDMPGVLIHYTTDGSHPDAFSPVYNAAFELPEGPVVLRTTTSRHGKVLGRTIVLTREELLKRK